MAHTSKTPLHSRKTAWTFRGRPVMPTTTEGRLALLMALMVAIPFIAGMAMLATPIMLFLAFRRGDRGLLLFVPLLAVLFLVVFVVAEFTIGHD